MTDMPAQATVRDLRHGDIAAAHALLARHGWAERIGDLERFTLLLERSQRVAVAVVDDTLVGFARGLTDGLSNGYLSMVLVAPGQRGRGIGRALVRHVTGDDPSITWVLRAGREGAAAFFERLGFSPSGLAMERLRR
ncbi:GNAT family N-acetyltransferase [Fulvimonas sp. R45]|uniref:GNAT family N-acetyltransferase n=1 Tax=Fulvimonas sp. R45 TaxID=3045937 RepID=UPI00265F5479|nr:GNAT family N-acetyltransferase [Fulvimonas sp. R45]MDO1529315.1 GNAT family N-acetyltransferase [Fulvimonas sp. R45]